MTTTPICVGCQLPMLAHDVEEHTCTKSGNLTLSLLQYYCTECGAGVYIPVQIRKAGDDPAGARVEMVTYTVSNMINLEADLDEQVLLEAAREQLYKEMSCVCAAHTGKGWYAGFEIDLWESMINGETEDSALQYITPEQRNKIDFLSSELNGWFAWPETWKGLEEEDSDGFVTMKKWRQMYKNKDNEYDENKNVGPGPV